MTSYPKKTVNWLDVDFEYLFQIKDISKDFYNKMKNKKNIYEVSYFNLDNNGNKDWEGGYWFENKRLRDDYFNKEVEQWTVWVGGTEVTDNYVDRDTADSILTDYLHQGYDEKDVWIEEVKND